MKNHYYLIKDETSDGDYSYQEQTIVFSSKPEGKWGEGWEKYFLNWQSSVTEVDEDGDTWSDHRIVEVADVMELSNLNHAVVLEQVLGSFDMDVILQEGKDNWDAHE
jgi:hypothetical protein